MNKFIKKDGTLSARAERLLIIAMTGVCADRRYTKKGVILRLKLKDYGGHGRFTHVNDCDHRFFKEMMDAAGIDFAEGNEAPRGGKIGDFIEVKALDILSLIRNPSRLDHE